MEELKVDRRNTWHYGIILHSEDGEPGEIKEYASIGEIYYFNNPEKPVTWCEPNLTCYDSAQECIDAIERIREDISRFGVFGYPEDFAT